MNAIFVRAMLKRLSTVEVYVSKSTMMHWLFVTQRIVIMGMELGSLCKAHEVSCDGQLCQRQS